MRVLRNILSAVSLSFFCASAAVQAGQVKLIVKQAKVASPYLVFVCEGEKYDPSVVLNGKSTILNRKTPEASMATYFTALQTKNVELYDSLYAPNEQTSTLDVGASGMFEAMSLKAKFFYGVYTIVVFEGKVGTSTGLSTAVMKKVGEEYCLTDKLIEDQTYHYISSFFRSKKVDIELTSASSGAKASDPHLAFTNTVHAFAKSNALPPIVVEWQGTNYGSSSSFDPATFVKEKQTLASPDGAHLAVYAAATAGDLKWYTSLVSSDEIDEKLQTPAGQTRTIRQEIEADFENTSKRMKLLKSPRIENVVYWGNYAVVKTSSSSGTNYLSYRKTKDEWRLTDELNREHPVGNFLLNAKGPNDIREFSNILPK